MSAKSRRCCIFISTFIQHLQWRRLVMKQLMLQYFVMFCPCCVCLFLSLSRCSMTTSPTPLFLWRYFSHKYCSSLLFPLPRLILFFERRRTSHYDRYSSISYFLSFFFFFRYSSMLLSYLFFLSYSLHKNIYFHYFLLRLIAYNR